MVSQELGTPVTAQSVHGWVQEIGRRVEERELSCPVASPTPREVVVTDIDDTVVRVWIARSSQLPLVMAIDKALLFRTRWFELRRGFNIKQMGDRKSVV